MKYKLVMSKIFTILTLFLLLLALPGIRPTSHSESEIDCFNRKNKDLARLLKDGNNRETIENAPKGTYAQREKKCWNHNDKLNISTAVKLVAARQHQFKLIPHFVRNITTILRFNKHIVADLLKILENSINIIPVNDNLPEMYDYIRYGKVKKADPFLTQHSAEMWIPFILEHHKYGSRLAYNNKDANRGTSQHARKEEKPSSQSKLPPLFHYIASHVYTFGLYVGNEDKVIINNIQFYWNKITNDFQKHEIWNSANGFDVIIPASHPMTPLNIYSDVSRLMTLAQSTFLVTDHDMKSRFSKDTIIPYFAGVFTTPSFSSREILVFFTGNPNQQLRKLLIQNIASLRETNPSELKDVIIRDKIADVEEYIALLHHSRFCLILRGDTTTSNRLFMAINSGCIPVIVSDWIILPFERIIDYTAFVIKVEESFVLQEPLNLIRFLRNIPANQVSSMQQALIYAREALSYDSSLELNPVSLIMMDTLLHRIEYCTNIIGNENIPNYSVIADNALCSRIDARIQTKININLLELHAKLHSFSCKRHSGGKKFSICHKGFGTITDFVE